MSVRVVSEPEERRFDELVPLHAKQRLVIEAMYSRPRPVILAGGSGFGGKSHGLRACMVHHNMFLAQQGVGVPRTVIACESYESLRDRHFDGLSREWGMFGSLRGADFEGGRIFKFHNPALGWISLRNLKNVHERRGSQFMGGALDESTEILEDTFGDFSYMMRYPDLPFIPVVCATNPDGPGFQWNKDTWRPQLGSNYEEDPETGELRLAFPPRRLRAFSRHTDPSGEMNPADYIYIQYLPTDNPAFREEEFNRMVSHLPAHVQRARRYGLWDAPEGARWPYLTPEKHLFAMSETFPKGIPEHWPRLLHCDYGIRAPFCALWTAFDHDGNAYTYRELYSAGLRADEQAALILEHTAEDERISEIRLDPAMWQSFPRHQFVPTADTRKPVGPADIYADAFAPDKRFLTSPQPGYNHSRVLAMASLDKYLGRDNGHPDWYIEEGCTSLWSELTGAVYDSGTDAKNRSEDLDPKVPDHAITASYYGLHHHSRQAEAVAAPSKPITQEDVMKARAEMLRQRDAKMAKKAMKRINR